MILNKKVNETASFGVVNTVQMEVDASDMGKVLLMLGEGLYKDPIGSVIREWTSNALDSHTEAKIDEPVIVSVDRDDNKVWWLKVQDFGMGISPERQKNVVSKYGASTKEQSEELLGCYGLGLKSGLAYQDSFTYVTRYDGIEYTYIMFKGEERTSINLVKESPTEERNGTTFILHIKDFSDADEFIDKCRQQLCYFENVHFKNDFIENDFNIYKSINWKYSTLNEDSNLHLCLDNVYYSIDFQRLGIKPINVPIGLNFKISDGLRPIPSREDILYSPTSKAMIIAKIREVATELYEKYNEENTDAEGFADIIHRFGTKQHNIKDEQGNNVANLTLSYLSDYTDVKLKEPTIKGVELLDLRDLYNKNSSLFAHYEIRGSVYNGTFRGKTEGDTSKLLTADRKSYILCQERPKGVVLDYIKSTHSNVAFLYKKRDRKLKSSVWGHDDSYMWLLDLKKKEKSTWRQRIKEYQSIEDKIISKFTRVESIVPDAQWLIDRKASRKRGSSLSVSKEEVNPKWSSTADRGGYEAIYTSKGAISIATLAKKGRLYVYGVLEERSILDKAFLMGKRNGRIDTVVFSNRDVEKMDKANLHNWIKIEKFMEGNTKPFMVSCTAQLIEKFKSDYNKVWQYKEFISHVSNFVFDKIKTLSVYHNTNYASCSSRLRDELIKYAEENNLFEPEIVILINELKEIMPKLDFFEVLNISTYKTPEPAQIKVAVDLMKYRKIKVNLNYYEQPKGIEMPITVEATISTEWEPDDEEEPEISVPVEEEETEFVNN